jgi:stress response protein YsnF
LTARLALDGQHPGALSASETRHLEVTVRREELVIDREPLAEAPVAAVRPPPEPLVVVLHEEVPVVDIRTRPYQEVTVTVELVTTEQPVSTELQHEHIQVETDTAAGDAP